ncbi:MAG: DUF1016 domain-containing protein [bacterium]|nr:DUF1016 domain-containing protein [bacterium]
MPEEAVVKKTPAGLFKEISSLINEAKSNIKVAVNSGMVQLYWNIGKTIKADILNNKRADYGKKVVEQLSLELTKSFGRGFEKTSLTRMIKFYDTFPENSIVVTLSQQFAWSHFVEFIKIEDSLKREFYIALCGNEGWSVRTLRGRIDSMLFERTALSRKPENTIINDLKKLGKEGEMSLDLVLRDPYILDFLNLNSEYSEADLETAILIELQNFILELGTDFAFLARQKYFFFDGETYKIDLLFFHRKLRRLVAIDLKLGKFLPKDKGQMEFYLRWLRKYEMSEGEEEPMGLILCAEKSKEVIELMELDKSGIQVAQYLTELPEKKLFKKKLHEAVKRARLLYDPVEEK